MSEFGVKLNFDDGGIAERLNKTADLFDQLASEAKELDGIMKTASKSSVMSLKQIENATAGSLGAMVKSNADLEKSFKSQKDKIAAVAITIAKNTTEADKLVGVYNKLIAAKNKGVLLDANDIAELTTGFDQFAETLGLTQDELDLIQLNLGEVVEGIQKVRSDEFKELSSNAKDVTSKFKSAKQELRALTNAINSGQLEGDELVIAKQRAAQLTDEIGDTRDEINRMASDTRGFDNLADGMRLLSSGMQLVEGSAALMGDENQDLQQSLLRLNAIMAISNALTSTAEDFTRKGSLAQKAYAAVVGNSTGVLKLFRFALAATGIGLVIILVSSLVSNWDSMKKSISQTVPVLAPVIEFFSELKANLFGAISGMTAFFKGAGSLLDGFQKEGFTGLKKAWKTLGSDIAKEYVNEKNKVIAADANKELAKDIDKLVAAQRRKKAELEAAGKDTTNIQRSILERELKSLQLSGAEKEAILDKQSELEVFNTEQTKKQYDKRLELLKDFNDKLKAITSENAKLRNDAELSGASDPRQRLAIEERLQLEANEKNRAAALEGIKDKAFIAKLNEQYNEQAILIKDAYVGRLIEVLEKETEVEANANKEKLQAQQERLNLDLSLREKEIDNIIQSGQLSVAEIAFWEQEKLQTKINAAKDNIALLLSAKDIDQNAVRVAQTELAALEVEFGNKRLDIKKAQANASTEAQIKAIDLELQYGEKSERQRAKLEQRKLKLLLESSKEQLKLLANPLSQEGVDLSNYITEIEAQLKNVGSELSKPFKSFKELFQNTLDDVFNIGDGKSEALIEGFNSLKDSVLDVVNAGFEAEIDALDQSISIRQDKISELESLIQEELDAKNKGYANDYDALVAQKANEEALLKEDNKKKVEIQKEALRVQLAVDGAQQISALATAVAGIFSKSATALGPFGIPIAIAAIVSMFALFRNYKNQVKALSTSAYKGGKISDYLLPGETAKSDRPGYGEGHRVEGTNLKIGADEFLVNAVTTSKHLPFLNEFNKGTFDNIDFMKAVNSAPDKSVLVKVVRDQQAKERVENKNILNKEFLKEVITEQTRELIDLEMKKPIVVNLPNGDVEVTYLKKNGVNKRVIKAR